MKKFSTTLAIAIVAATFLFGATPSQAGCFQQYAATVSDCANLGSFIDRSACGLDAGVELTGCVRRTILG